MTPIACLLEVLFLFVLFLTVYDMGEGKKECSNFVFIA